MVESDVTRSRSRYRKIERFIHFTSFKHRNLMPKTLSRQHHGTIVDRTYVVIFSTKQVGESATITTCTKLEMMAIKCLPMAQCLCQAFG